MADESTDGGSVGAISASMSLDTNGFVSGVEKIVKSIEGMSKRTEFVMASIVDSFDISQKKSLNPLKKLSEELDKTIGYLARSVTSLTRAIHAQNVILERSNVVMRTQNEQMKAGVELTDRLAVERIKLEKIQADAASKEAIAQKELEAAQIAANAKIEAMKLQQETVIRKQEEETARLREERAAKEELRQKQRAERQADIAKKTAERELKAQQAAQHKIDMERKKALELESALRQRYSGVWGGLLRGYDAFMGTHFNKFRSEIRESSRALFAMTRTIGSSFGFGIGNYGAVSGIIRLLTTGAGKVAAAWIAAIGGIALGIARMNKLAMQFNEQTQKFAYETNANYKMVAEATATWSNLINDATSGYTAIGAILGGIYATVTKIAEGWMIISKLLTTSFKDYGKMLDDIYKQSNDPILYANQRKYNEELQKSTTSLTEYQRLLFLQISIAKQLDFLREKNKEFKPKDADKALKYYEEYVKLFSKTVGEIMESQSKIEELNKSINDAWLTDNEKQRKALKEKSDILKSFGVVPDSSIKDDGLRESKNLQALSVAYRNLSNEAITLWTNVNDLNKADGDRLDAIKKQIPLYMRYQQLVVEEQKELGKLRQDVQNQITALNEHRKATKLANLPLEERIQALKKLADAELKTWMDTTNVTVGAKARLKLIDYSKQLFDAETELAKKRGDMEKNYKGIVEKTAEELKNIRSKELIHFEEYANTVSRLEKEIAVVRKVTSDTPKYSDTYEKALQHEQALVKELAQFQSQARIKEIEDLQNLAKELDEALIPAWRRAEKGADKYFLLVEKGMRSSGDVLRYLSDAFEQSMRSFGGTRGNSELDEFNRKFEESNALLKASQKILDSTKTTNEERVRIGNLIEEQQARLNKLHKDFTLILGGQETKAWQDLKSQIEGWNKLMEAGKMTQKEVNLRLEDETHKILGLSRSYDKFIESLKNLDSIRKSGMYSSSQTDKWQDEIIRNSSNPYDKQLSTDETIKSSGFAQQGVNPYLDTLQGLKEANAEELRLLEEHFAKIERMTFLSEDKKLQYKEKAHKLYLNRTKTYQVQEAQMLISGFENIFGGLADVFRNVKGEQDKTYKIMFATSKAFAMAEAVIMGVLATQKALAQYSPPVNFIMAGLTAAMAAVNVAKIGSEMLSFEGGGYTPTGNRAGGVDGRGGFPAILHPDEKVIDLTRSPDSDRFGKGTFTSNINIYNSSGASVTPVTNSNGDVDIMVEAVERKLSTGIARGTGRLSNTISSTYGIHRNGRRT